MRLRVRENLPCALAATAASGVVAWLGLYGFAWNDYEVEAQPAVNALVAGHLAQFLRLAPSYGGSLIERAPFALLPGLWGGGQLAVYRLLALPCLLAAIVLAVWLCGRMRAAGRSRLARAVAVGICVANPLTVQALELGHPEELLGACLCVAAVLLAARGRAVWAGAVLGLAIANKEWALLAVGPVLLVLAACPTVSRPRHAIALCLGVTGAVAGAILAPLLLVSSGGFAAGARGVASPGDGLFQPWQLWWFLGAPNHVVAHGGPMPMNAPLATHPQWRLSPAGLAGVAHPLIVAMGLPLSALAWRRRRVAGAPLLALALLLLLRCMVDPWDIGYYVLPFVLALVTWEGLYAGHRTPTLALVVTALAWIDFVWMPNHASPDVEAALFLAWTLPLATALGLRLFAASIPRPLSWLAAIRNRDARRERESSRGEQALAGPI